MNVAITYEVYQSDPKLWNQVIATIKIHNKVYLISDEIVDEKIQKRFDSIITYDDSFFFEIRTWITHE